MSRFINALLVFLMVLSAAAVYDMKYEAELAAGALAELEQKIAAEQAELSVLKAEWSVLTQPARLEDLVQRHQDILQLQALTADQIGTLADIPAKPAVIEPEAAVPPAASEPPQRSASAEVEAPVGDDDSGMVR